MTTEDLQTQHADGRLTVLCFFAIVVLGLNLISRTKDVSPFYYRLYNSGGTEQRGLVACRSAEACSSLTGQYPENSLQIYDYSSYEYPAASALFFNRPLPINQASKEELTLLPGIGPGLAGRIIEYRTTQSTFSTLEQLEQVHGLGPKRIERLAQMIRFD